MSNSSNNKVEFLENKVKFTKFMDESMKRETQPQNPATWEKKTLIHSNRKDNVPFGPPYKSFLKTTPKWKNFHMEHYLICLSAKLKQCVKIPALSHVKKKEADNMVE